MQYVSRRPRFSRVPGLGRVRKLLDAVGNPHHACRYVHVGGTNGKGSTTAMVASVLTEAGFETGMYTSPHLERLEERIAVNGTPIAPEELVELVEGIRPVVEEFERHEGEPVIEFELLTALAFLYFRNRRCDLGVLEVGLGGRFDATNVIDAPLAVVITSIGRDHTEVLGDSPEEIASEKAGIVKPQTLVISAVRAAGPAAVIARASAENAATLWTVAPGDWIGERGSVSPADVTWHRTGYDTYGQRFDVTTPHASYEGLFTRLLGRHQMDNAACAVAALEGVRRAGLFVADGAVRRGLATAEWPGRFEIVRRNPWVVIDGAHNPEGASALALTLVELFPGHKATLVLGVLSDKEIRPVVSVLAPLAHRVIVTSPTHPTRALPPSELASAVGAAGTPAEVCEPAVEAIRRGLDMLKGRESVLLITGSLYLTGEARRVLRELAVG